MAAARWRQGGQQELMRTGKPEILPDSSTLLYKTSGPLAAGHGRAYNLVKIPCRMRDPVLNIP